MDQTLRDTLLGRTSWEQLLTAAGLTARRKESGIYVLCCCFHEEKTPSLCLRPTGRYRCYGCGESGDRIDFIRRHWHLRFDELRAFIEALPPPPNPDQLELENVS